jgi:hypothetical protein
MTEDDVDKALGPKPDAFTEPPERFPGGADSVADEEKYGARPDAPLAPDLDPEANPAVEDHAPDEIKQPDDKQQEPDTGTSGDPEAEPEDEEPA